MCERFFLVFWLFCLFFVPFLVYAQDVPQDPLLSQQMILSSQVRSALLESKRSMEKSEEYFNSMIASLEERSQAQSEELMTLSKLWIDTTLSFKAASKALEELNVQLEVWKEKYWTLFKVAIVGSILFLINVVAKILLQILHAKGIKLPYWIALWV